jgi:hypothetical protein
MTKSAVLPVLVMALLVYTCAGQGAIYFAGSGAQVATGGPAIVVLVEELDELEKEYVNEFATKYGAAVGLQASGNLGVFSAGASPEEMMEQLSSSLTATSVLSSDASLEKFPIVAFGAAANSALKLAYAGWVSEPPTPPACYPLSPHHLIGSSAATARTK